MNLFFLGYPANEYTSLIPKRSFPYESDVYPCFVDCSSLCTSLRCPRKVSYGYEFFQCQSTNSTDLWSAIPSQNVCEDSNGFVFGIPQVYLETGVRYTLSFPFSHKLKIRWLSIQFKLSFEIRRSKFHRILERIRRISMYARFLPRQFRGPRWNGWKASLWSFANAGSPSQRSGWNLNGSLKCSSL
jgi:hypothetical protein